MIAILTVALPILLEVLKLFFAAPSDKRADVAKSILSDLAKIRAAITKAEETGGSTEDIEDIINGRNK